MASPRLLFLYPSLSRSCRTLRPSAAQEGIDIAQRPRVRRDCFHTSPNRLLQHLRHRQDPNVQPPPPPPASGLGRAPAKASKDAPKTSNEAAKAIEKGADTAAVDAASKPSATRSEEKTDVEPLSESADAGQSTTTLSPDTVTEKLAESTTAGSRPEGKSPDAVLYMDPPSPPEGQAPDQLSTPQPLQLHHFDMYSLVRELQKHDFTEEQSVAVMKTVRALLEENIVRAGEGLVSKSDVENARYLFRAACSELATEIQRNRKVETERMRTDRAQLQQEVDVLGQRLSQELLALKDDLRGMFNDRKMEVRMEQRSADSSIQELNYKITVLLNSDSKSDVEGLRWLLARRAAIAIASMAVLILGSLRYNSYQAHAAKAAEQAAASGTARPSDVSPTSSPHRLEFGSASTNSRTTASSNLGSLGVAGSSSFAPPDQRQEATQMGGLPQRQDPTYESLG